MQVHPSQVMSLHKHQSPCLQAHPIFNSTSLNCLLLIPFNTLHPQLLMALPSIQILSEEQGREMPNQQPAFGTLN
jgi:hypothetical protein